jgi:DNA-binding NtrC family response regulator
VTSWLKKILKIRLGMPIIICTGFNEKMNGEEAIIIGATGYLEKPHEKRDLAKMIRKVLNGK